MREPQAFLVIFAVVGVAWAAIAFAVIAGIEVAAIILAVRGGDKPRTLPDPSPSQRKALDAVAHFAEE